MADKELHDSKNKSLSMKTLNPCQFFTLRWKIENFSTIPFDRALRSLDFNPRNENIWFATLTKSKVPHKSASKNFKNLFRLQFFTLPDQPEVLDVVGIRMYDSNGKSLHRIAAVNVMDDKTFEFDLLTGPGSNGVDKEFNMEVIIVIQLIFSGYGIVTVPDDSKIELEV